MAIALFGSENLTIELKLVTEPVWSTLVNAMSYVENTAENPSREVMNFSSISEKQLGASRIPDIVIGYNPLPHHSVYMMLHRAWTQRLLLNVRVTTQEIPRFQAHNSADTVAIATNGTVTFAGTAPPIESLAPGLVLVVGSDSYVIDTVVSNTNTVTVSPAPSSAVTAMMGYIVNTPSIVRNFTGYLVTLNQISFESESSGSSTMKFHPIHTLPDWAMAA